MNKKLRNQFKAIFNDLIIDYDFNLKKEVSTNTYIFITKLSNKFKPLLKNDNKFSKGFDYVSKFSKCDFSGLCCCKILLTENALIEKLTNSMYTDKKYANLDVWNYIFLNITSTLKELLNDTWISGATYIYKNFNNISSLGHILEIANNGSLSRNNEVYYIIENWVENFIDGFEDNSLNDLTKETILNELFYNYQLYENNLDYHHISDVLSKYLPSKYYDIDTNEIYFENLLNSIFVNSNVYNNEETNDYSSPGESRFDEVLAWVENFFSGLFLSPKYYNILTNELIDKYDNSGLTFDEAQEIIDKYGAWLDSKNKYNDLIECLSID